LQCGSSNIPRLSLTVGTTTMCNFIYSLTKINALTHYSSIINTTYFSFVYKSGTSPKANIWEELKWVFF